MLCVCMRVVTYQDAFEHEETRKIINSSSDEKQNPPELSNGETFKTPSQLLCLTLSSTFPPAPHSCDAFTHCHLSAHLGTKTSVTLWRIASPSEAPRSFTLPSASHGREDDGERAFLVPHFAHGGGGKKGSPIYLRTAAGRRAPPFTSGRRWQHQAPPRRFRSAAVGGGGTGRWVVAVLLPRGKRPWVGLGLSVL